MIEHFAENVAEYEAAVHRVSEADLKEAITEACRRRGARRLVVPPGLPEGWVPDGVEALRDDTGTQLTKEELDKSDGVLTGCALGIAQTGTIVLDAGERQGRRALTLLPDYHLCVVRKEQIVGLVPEAFARLANAVKTEGRAVTFISGPSATSDIELDRVEGVHGFGLYQSSSFNHRAGSAATSDTQSFWSSVSLRTAFREPAMEDILPAGVRPSVPFIPTTSGALALGGVASIATSFPRPVLPTWNRDYLYTPSLARF
jgi:L-lactate dehydrogenase complex protein LldG